MILPIIFNTVSIVLLSVALILQSILNRRIQKDFEKIWNNQRLLFENLKLNADYWTKHLKDEHNITFEDEKPNRAEA